MKVFIVPPIKRCRKTLTKIKNIKAASRSDTCCIAGLANAGIFDFCQVLKERFCWRNNIYRLVPFICLLALLCGCAKGGERGFEPHGTVFTSDIYDIAHDGEETPPPFSSYAFEFDGTSGSYIVFVRKGEHPDEISLTVENNRYESRDLVITAPTGYEPVFPLSDADSADAVKLIKNDINSEKVPDIMQFGFSAAKSDTESSARAVSREISRLYTIDGSGEVREIKIVGIESDEDGKRKKVVRDYLDRTLIYRCEPLKFIYEITVDDNNIYDDEGQPRSVESRVKIKTLTFDPEKLLLNERFESLDEQHPLYFGYACWAAANTAAQYFTVKTLNITDIENYAERPRLDDSSLSDYYYPIDDERFENTRDLKMYLRTVFTPAEADRIFSEAPQRYTDIKGRLYGIVTDADTDMSLGTLTFSNFTIADDRMVFFSRQEKYDENGDFTGYTDGGNFVIVKGADGLWKVSSYRYPYS